MRLQITVPFLSQGVELLKRLSIFYNTQVSLPLNGALSLNSKLAFTPKQETIQSFPKTAFQISVKKIKNCIKSLIVCASGFFIINATRKPFLLLL